MSDERRLAVLRAIVEDYVSTREPVGSKNLVERYQLGISPATIRNDMAVLEEEGYITQPHTSAGRVPTDKGYRLFVDRLARPVRATPKATRPTRPRRSTNRAAFHRRPTHHRRRTHRRRPTSTLRPEGPHSTATRPRRATPRRTMSAIGF